MPKRIDLLDRIEVASPCRADWDEMVGNEQVRFCRGCSLYVHDLSKVTRKDALALVAASQGRLCVRYYKRPDGRLSTDERAAPLGNVRRRLSRLAAGAFSATLGLASNVAAQSPEPRLGRALVSIQPAAKSKQPRAAADPGQKAALAGTVYDPAEAVVPGATVTLTAEKGGTALTAVTDAAGSFRFQDLRAGVYKLTIESAGFQTFVRDPLVLKPGAERRIAPSLELGGVMGVMMAAPDTLLVRAIWREDVREVERLLAEGADVNELDESTNSAPLAEAAATGNLEMVRTLLAAGAEPNARNSRGTTALMRLDDDAGAELVRTLLAAGAKVNLKNEEGQTALHVAAEFQTAEALGVLLEAGAKVNASDKEGKTPLMIAAEENRLDNVKALIAAGADPDRRSKEGETALKLAREYEYWEVIAALVAQGARE